MPIIDQPTEIDADPLGRLTFESIGYRRGVWFYAAWTEAFHGPVGMAWIIRSGCHDGRAVGELLHIYVPPFARRRGVGHGLLDAIAADCDVIQTAAGSVDGGEALIRAYGFVWDAASACWAWPCSTREIENQKSSTQKIENQK